MIVAGTIQPALGLVAIAGGLQRVFAEVVLVGLADARPTLSASDEE